MFFSDFYTPIGAMPYHQNKTIEPPYKIDAEGNQDNPPNPKTHILNGIYCDKAGDQRQAHTQKETDGNEGTFETECGLRH